MSVVKWIFIITLSLPVHEAAEYAPRNQVIVAGRNVTLKCWSDSNGTTQWKHRQGTRDEETYLTSNQDTASNNARMMLNTTIDGQYDLHITNVDRPDAGTYICIKTKKATSGRGSFVSRRYGAQLVILTSDANCTLNTITGNNTLKENDYVQMRCFVRFVGDLVPVMKWRRGRQLVKGAETQTTKAPVGNQITVTTSLSVQVNFMDNGVSFSCDAFFTLNVYNNSSDGFLIKAANTPDYKYTWTSPPLIVSYGPRNLRILFSNESNEDGLFTISDDHLECYADGNPTPRYEWTIETKHMNITVHNIVIYLNESMFSNEQFAVECKAINDFGEQIERVLVIKRPSVNATDGVVHSSTCVPCTCTTWIMVIAIIGITNVASVTACIVFIVKQRMKEGVPLVVTDTTTTTTTPATTSSTGYAELHHYTTPQHMSNYANINLQEETAYTALNVSQRQHKQPIIYANQQ